MIRYLTHHDGRTWRADALDDEIRVRITTDGNVEEKLVDTLEEFGTPPEYSFEEILDGPLEEGFEFTSIPDVHLEIEKAHSCALPEPIRQFYATQKYLEFEDKFCPSLGCHLDFTADSVLGNYHQTHYDSELEAERSFVPLSARVYEGIEDEQQWIGFDPKEINGPIYSLFTSGSFEIAFKSLDAFLENLIEKD